MKADLKGHGSWYTGRIIAIDTKFRVFTIKYENGHLEKHVPPSRVQPMSTGHLKNDYVHGERVRANWQSCGTSPIWANSLYIILIDSCSYLYILVLQKHNILLQRVSKKVAKSRDNVLL